MMSRKLLLLAEIGLGTLAISLVLTLVVIVGLTVSGVLIL
jgi:hypothetical protein